MICFRFKIATEKNIRNAKKSPFVWIFALLNKGDLKNILYVLFILDKEKVTTFYEKTNAIQIMRKESKISWIVNNWNCSTNPP